ncbi:MAG TPA: BamA/TamA family outer membrane protein [Thermoanaerobaculia bacterium]|nr:BamA/TamA family outer membrane protein [Thermoanaerobaculia bacterium]
MGCARSDRRRRLSALAILLSVLLATTVDAQYFGRNKVKWEDFDFWVRRSAHFDVYAYPADNRAADDAIRMAERWYGRFSREFRHEFRERKPIILYADHADFQQTSTTGGLIEEGVGGFTEPLRNRIVIPLTGVYADTDHVLGHELVHEFQFDIAARGEERARRPRTAGIEQLPLWMIEGLAEWLSQGREDPQTAVWLRDAVIHNRLPDLDKLARDPRFSPYHWGQAAWAYIAGRWGESDAISLFRTSIRGGVEPAFKSVLGLSTKEFSAQWKEAIRTSQGPIAQRRGNAADWGEPLLTRERTAARINLAPALSPDGSRVAFLSTRGVFNIELWLADVRTGKVLDRLASETTDPHFDALRFIDSAGSWSPDGRKLAFVVFARGDNQLAILDVDSGRIERQADVRGAGALSNPAWSPDGRTIAVSGTEKGVSDLYLYDLESGSSRRLTDDLYADLEPTWSPDGRTIAFVSDRGPATDFAQLRYVPVGIFLMDVASGAIRPLPTFSRGRQINPQFSPDGGEIFFIADPDGVSDVFRVPVAGGVVSRVTRVATAVAGITDLAPALSVARGNGDVAYSILNGGSYEIRRIPADRARTAALPELDPADGPRLAAMLPPPAPRAETATPDVPLAISEPAPAPESLRAAPRERYRPGLGLAFVGPATVGVGSDRIGYGVGGAISAYFTDLLGEHQVAVAIQGGAQSGQSFGNTFGGQLVYLNQSKRFQWGAGLGHIPYQSASTFVSSAPSGGTIVEQFIETVTTDQVSLFAQYPLSQTRRLEGTAAYTRYGFELEVERFLVVGGLIEDQETEQLPAPESLNLYEGSIAYVGDNSSFGFISPVRGGRMRIEAGTSVGTLQYQTALVDLRRYFFARPVTFAVRGLHYGRYGSDAESDLLFPLYVGQQTLVRGYGVGDFDPDECTRGEDTSACPEFDRLVGSRVGVANVEVRVPLLGTEDFGLVRAPLFPTELVAFADAGVAWSRGESPKVRFDRDTIERVPVVSAGVAVRVLIAGFLPIQVYYAVPFQRPRQSGVWGFLIAPGW